MLQTSNREWMSGCWPHYVVEGDLRAAVEVSSVGWTHSVPGQVVALAGRVANDETIGARGLMQVGRYTGASGPSRRAARAGMGGLAWEGWHGRRAAAWGRRAYAQLARARRGAAGVCEAGRERLAGRARAGPWRA